MAITVPTREHLGSAKPATLMAGLDAGSPGPMVCDDLSGWPLGIGYDEFVVTVGRGLPGEERILCSATSGDTLVVKQRGWDGTIASTHDMGETVEHTYSAVEAQEANDHITATVAHGAGGNVVGADDLALVLARTNFIPPGTISAYAADSPPNGWLMCQGQTLAATVCPLLYAAIGTTYGSDGPGTFKLPDLTGKVVLGKSNTHALASAGGAETKALVEANLPHHQHTVPDHSHTINHDHGAATSSIESGEHGHLGATDVQGSHNHFIPISAQAQYGGGAGIPDTNGVQTPAAATKDGSGAHQHGLTTSGQTANHTHSVDLPLFSGSSGQVTGVLTGVGAGSATAFSVMQPYLTLNWIIKIDAEAQLPI